MRAVVQQEQSEAKAANFDRVAGVYRWAEYLLLGSALRRTRESLLPVMARQRRALLLGDGDGRFAAALLRASPAIQVHAVDTSARMLLLLARRCERNGQIARLCTEQISAAQAQPEADCDLVVAHFVLDCMTQGEVEVLAQRLSAQLRPGTPWVISDFDLPQAPVLRSLARIYIRMLYLAFYALTGLRVQRLPDVAKALRAAGWQRMERRERLKGLLYSELWQVGETDAPTGIHRATSTRA